MSPGAGPRVLVSTSWDDGHVLDLRVAGMLADRGLAGTFYVAPEDRELAAASRLRPAQVAELGGTFEIGAHTLTHQRLTHLDPESSREEIVRGREVLQDWTGSSVTSFCYPGGEYSALHVDQVRACGFTYARTVERWTLDTSLDAPLEAGTTVHAYRHFVDPVTIARAFPRAPRSWPTLFRNWDRLAIALFERAKENGAAWHFWGHSWEVHEHGDWERLTRVLDHVAQDPASLPVTNRRLAMELAPGGRP
jgi:peptidoglycan/xylan/chitin deacetylase (PgdA/CDA1 family)